MAKKDIKEAIISAARKLIKEQGSFSIKELTEATNTNIASVNYHFGSKDNLSRILINDLIINLREVLSFYIFEVAPAVSLEIFIDQIINILYDYTVDNAMLLRYLFVTLEGQKDTINELLSLFFSDNDFTKAIYKQLGAVINSTNPKEIAARYMIFFVSGIVPMLLELIKGREESIASLKDPEFKKFYLEGMRKLLS